MGSSHAETAISIARLPQRSHLPVHVRRFRRYFRM